MDNAIKNDERLDWKAACDFLGCKKSTLYRMIYDGRLPAYGVGRRNRFILRSDCEKILQDKEQYDFMD